MAPRTVASDPAGAAPTRRNPFINTDYRRWWVASVVVAFGVGFQVVTVPLFIRDRVDPDERAGFIAAALVVQMLPGALLTLVGGVVADRVERRLILVRAYAVAAVVSLAYVGLSAADARAIWPVFLLSAVVGSSNAFANPARQSLIPQVLDRAQIQNGVILGTMAFMAALQFGGPSIGGLLADGLGLTTAFAVEAGFLAAGVAVFSRMRKYEPVPTGRSIRAEFVEGLRYARRTPMIPGLMLLAMAPGIFFVGPMQVTMVILVEDVLEASDKFVGILFGCFGLGVVVGSIALTFRPTPRRGLMLILSLFQGSAFFVLFGMSGNVALSMGILFVFGLGAAVFINLAVSLLQEHTDPAMMGRVMSMYSLGFIASQPVGLAQAGVVATVFGPQAAIIGSGVAVGLVAAAALATLTPVRRLD